MALHLAGRLLPYTRPASQMGLKLHRPQGRISKSHMSQEQTDVYGQSEAKYLFPVADDNPVMFPWKEILVKERCGQNNSMAGDKKGRFFFIQTNSKGLARPCPRRRRFVHKHGLLWFSRGMETWKLALPSVKQGRWALCALWDRRSSAEKAKNPFLDGLSV